MTTAERIRHARQTAGLTQREVGERCGIADSAIRKYESGKVTPKLETVNKIANALGVSAAYLMGMEDSPAPSETIGHRIRAAREVLGMTQEELGSLCQTTKQTVFKYESGIVTNIPHDRVKQIAAALHVSPAYLLGIEDTDPMLSRLVAQLNAAGKDKLITYAEDLILSGRYAP